MALLFIGNAMLAQVGINADNSAPDESAGLDVKFSNKGFLPPRITSVARNAIVNPAAGLVIWCSNCGTTGELQVFNGTAWTNMTGGAAAAGLVAVGTLCMGGKIAYVLQPGDPGYVAGEFHGLIITINNVSIGTQWYNGTEISTGATATALGSGKANTSAIVNVQGAGAYAAKICYDLVLNGYSDWYLPSKDELNKLYLNRVAIGNFADDTYWSSSETDAIHAWGQLFINGYQYSGLKDVISYVRAVRAF